MELIKNFGIDPILLVAQIINFTIVLYVLRRFLYKPILGMLKKRQDIIREGIQKSEEANIRLAKALGEEKALLKNAQAFAKRIIDDAKSQMEERSNQVEEETKKRAEEILKEARGQIEREAKDTEKRLTLNIGSIAVDFLEKSIKDVFSENEQKEILKKALSKIKTK